MNLSFQVEQNVQILDLISDLCDEKRQQSFKLILMILLYNQKLK